MNYWQQTQRPRRGFGIPNLMTYLVFGMAIVYVMDIVLDTMHPGMKTFSLASLLAFDRSAILQGEVWRAVSFVLLPPATSTIWVVFSLYFDWLIGRSLEQEWGAQRFTTYYLIGMLGSIVSGFITGYTTNNYLNLSLFFAAATLFPNFQFYIFFIIPVKLKWLGWINAAMHILLFIVETPSGRAALLFALLNYFIFFGRTMFNTVRNFFGRNVRKTQFQMSKRQGERQNRNDVISKEDRDYWKNR